MNETLIIEDTEKNLNLLVNLNQILYVEYKNKELSSYLVNGMILKNKISEESWKNIKKSLNCEIFENKE